MKKNLISLSILFVFSCSDKKNISETKVLEPCECDTTFNSKTTIFATQIQAEKTENQTILSFNCTTIETAIASVTDEKTGDEFCKNLYQLNCISGLSKKLKLSNDFYYHTEEMKNMDITKGDAQKLFFTELKKNNKRYFELVLNEKREITSISLLPTNF